MAKCPTAGRRRAARAAHLARARKLPRYATRQTLCNGVDDRAVMPVRSREIVRERRDRHQAHAGEHPLSCTASAARARAMEARARVRPQGVARASASRQARPPGATPRRRRRHRFRMLCRHHGTSTRLGAVAHTASSPRRLSVQTMTPHVAQPEGKLDPETQDPVEQDRGHRRRLGPAERHQRDGEAALHHAEPARGDGQVGGELAGPVGEKETLPRDPDADGQNEHAARQPQSRIQLATPHPAADATRRTSKVDDRRAGDDGASMRPPHRPAATATSGGSARTTADTTHTAARRWRNNAPSTRAPTRTPPVTPTRSSPAPSAPATVTPTAATTAKVTDGGHEDRSQGPSGQGGVGAVAPVLAEGEHRRHDRAGRHRIGDGGGGHGHGGEASEGHVTSPAPSRRFWTRRRPPTSRPRPRRRGPATTSGDLRGSATRPTARPGRPVSTQRANTARANADDVLQPRPGAPEPRAPRPGVPVTSTRAPPGSSRARRVGRGPRRRRGRRRGRPCR